MLSFYDIFLLLLRLLSFILFRGFFAFATAFQCEKNRTHSFPGPTKSTLWLQNRATWTNVKSSVSWVLEHISLLQANNLCKNAQILRELLWFVAVARWEFWYSVYAYLWHESLVPILAVQFGLSWTCGPCGFTKLHALTASAFNIQNIRRMLPSSLIDCPTDFESHVDLNSYCW